MLTIVDVGICNLGSVVEALRRLGANTHIARKPSDLANASAVILPGVGAFGDGMGNLEKNGMIEPLVELAQSDRPFLGICLGMQLMATTGLENGPHQGLNLIPGVVDRLQGDGNECRVPNIGWCELNVRKSGTILPDAGVRRTYYFVHSYYFEPNDSESIAATIEFGGRKIPAAVRDGNLFGVQFHPEKSQDAGLELLHSFLAHAGQI